MKQGTSFSLPVTIDLGDIAFSEVSEIKFVFKQTRNRNDKALKVSTYKASGTCDAYIKTGVSNVVYVPWSADDTEKFKPNAKLYMDTQIKIKNSTEMPETSIVELTMNDTLFQR